MISFCVANISRFAVYDDMTKEITYPGVWYVDPTHGVFRKGFLLNSNAYEFLSKNTSASIHINPSFYHCCTIRDPFKVKLVYIHRDNVVKKREDIVVWKIMNS